MVSKCLNGCLIFAVCYFQLRKKCLQNFCSIEKWMMLEIIDENFLKIITLLNNLVLICRFATLLATYTFACL